MLKIFIIISAFFLTFFGVEVFRRWSLRKNILDMPNERSSHENPTPVGGGFIIVCVCLGLYFFYLVYFGSKIPWEYFGGAVIVALISWLDDLFGIPVIARFLCHGLAASWVIWGLGGYSFGFFSVFDHASASYLTIFFLFFWIVWMINSYNFMDGIDGIAAIQSITASVVWILAAESIGLESVGVLASVVAVSSFGFLILNWQPAKIFMGDVGSAFLGYTFAVIPILAQVEMPVGSSKYFMIALFSVWFFLFDTVITLMFRLSQGKRFWEAHREHLYQKLVISGYSHKFVALVYGAMSAAILLCVQIWLRYEGNTVFAVYGAIIILTIGIFVFAQKNVIFERKFRD